MYAKNLAIFFRSGNRHWTVTVYFLHDYVFFQTFILLLLRFLLLYFIIFLWRRPWITFILDFQQLHHDVIDTDRTFPKLIHLSRSIFGHFLFWIRHPGKNKLHFSLHMKYFIYLLLLFIVSAHDEWTRNATRIRNGGCLFDVVAFEPCSASHRWGWTNRNTSLADVKLLKLHTIKLSGADSVPGENNTYLIFFQRREQRFSHWPIMKFK